MKVRQLGLGACALFFVAVGVTHFTHPAFFLKIMPPALPAHLALVYLSGAFEILGGLGLLVPRTRRFAGWGLIALLIAVFPANLYMAAILLLAPFAEAEFFPPTCCCICCAYC